MPFGAVKIRLQRQVPIVNHVRAEIGHLFEFLPTELHASSLPQIGFAAEGKPFVSLSHLD
jgi:hypothetical protein